MNKTTPDLEICTTCKCQSTGPVPSRKTVENFAVRMNMPELRYPVCNSCLGRLRKNQLPKIDEPVIQLRAEAMKALKWNEYERFAKTYVRFDLLAANLDEELTALVDKIRFVNGRKDEVAQLKRQVDNALALKPNVTYFLRRIQANVAISDPELRVRIFSRNNFQCVHCQSKRGLTIDHIMPVHAGGTDAEDNLQTLCKPCNSRKGSKIPPLPLGKIE